VQDDADAATASRPEPPDRTATARGLVSAMRPRQWVKSLIVGIAPAASGEALHAHVLAHTALAFVAFCATSSATYLLNDVRDREADLQHPGKRWRPIATGVVPVDLALVAMAVLGCVGLAIGFATSWPLGVVLVLYLAESIAYSMGAKRISVIELGLITSGFVLRGVAGGVASGLPLSSWFLMVITFGALFVVVGKRLAEYHHLGEGAGAHRPVLATYTRSFLEAALTLSAAVTVTGYCLWGFAVDRNGLGHQHHQFWIQLSVAPVALAVLYVLLQLDAGRGGTPEDLVLRDRTVQALGLVWAVLVAVGIYA
ncbi:MAG TPA: decaprenyl-phosphate phosphoribosyltransferase, partial [Acidimicrobiales bacterium]|nr:decaprenyl-phosphate phosphoribosyltransferase [Acidimicrobiales bacterium]